MSLPASLLRYLIDRLRYPVTTIGVVVFATLFLAFLLTGTFRPQFEHYRVNVMESTGLSLLMSTLPAYLFMCMTAQVRATPAVKARLDTLLPATNRDLVTRLDGGRFWWAGMVLGMSFALSSNINWTSMTLQPADERFWWSVGTIFGQLFLWGTVGLMLYMKLSNSLLLHRMGQLVDVDIFNLDRLNLFGRTGINDLLLVAGAMALTPLQSLDQEFRWMNYRNAILVGVPSAILLMLLPTWSVHRRILRAKTEQVTLINAEIDRLPKTLAPDAVLALNALLDRRYFVQQCRNWPMDLSTFSRFMLYVLIPPLAWIGAALMELAVDSYLQ